MGKSLKTTIILTPSARKEDALRAVTAAQKLSGNDIDLWAFGISDSFLSTLPVKNIIQLSLNAPPLASHYLPPLEQLAATHPADIFLFTGGHFSSELAASFGCAMEGSCSLSVSDLRPLPDGVAAIRRVYGLQLEAELSFYKAPYVFSLSEGAFEPCLDSGSPTFQHFASPSVSTDWYTDYTEIPNSASAIREHELILVGGRGLNNAETALSLKKLGEILNAGIGGTRPAVWNSWFAPSQMIGLSGQSIRPKLCIVFGSSGCTPFIKGVEESRILAAINQDPDASIFSQCDLGVVGDCEEIIHELTVLVQEKAKYFQGRKNVTD